MLRFDERSVIWPVSLAAAGGTILIGLGLADPAR